ncbi:alpha-L-glutamate ligase-like protein [Marinobacter algicola]|uniref:Alpha-L-glutamate ligase-related protein n=1 Tax=Marinobacter algicola DG893 TaxID=443152 RepID=A6EUY2_9GAMM|nr:alpha-L-glutamate ligase-like protein [Marinobacter algicola]EDM49631.1 Alpha-L-glutamate ligase-related protein [Marinobacter algicola DG893]
MGWISPFKLNQLGMLNMNRRNVDYIARYNSRSSYPMVDNKLKTKLVVAEYDVRTPKLLQIVRQQHEISHFREMAEDLDGFAIKPAKGSGGKGITVITGRDDDEYIKASGSRVSSSHLERHLSNILAGLYSLAGTPDVAIVENLVESIPELAKYSFQGVPDIRIVVFQGYPVMAMLRLATKASDGKANLHQGAVGVGLNIANGRSLNAVQFNRPITLHPDTGLALENLLIDDWQEMLVMASRCYEATGLGYMGVDLVVDVNEGPLLLELNARPGLAIQMANGRGLLPRLRQIEALRRTHFTPEERAAFAMDTFTSQI